MAKIRDYDGILDELVFAIGNLHYDVTAVILKKIADNIAIKAYNDNDPKLRDISNYIYEAKDHLDIAWNKYCKDKMDCSKHPRKIPNFYSTYDKLGQDISNFPIPHLIMLMDKFGDDFLRQADADWKASKKKNATELYAAANSMYKGRMEA